MRDIFTSCNWRWPRAMVNLWFSNRMESHWHDLIQLYRMKSWFGKCGIETHFFVWKHLARQTLVTLWNVDATTFVLVLTNKTPLGFARAERFLNAVFWTVGYRIGWCSVFGSSYRLVSNHQVSNILHGPLCDFDTARGDLGRDFRSFVECRSSWNPHKGQYLCNRRWQHINTILYGISKDGQEVEA